MSGGRGCVGGLLGSPSSTCIGACRDVHKMFGQTEGKLGNFQEVPEENQEKCICYQISRLMLTLAG